MNREAISVGLGFTATVNIELSVASLQETVTVSGESPVVDISTTTTASNFGEQRLSALPNARDFWAVLAARRQSSSPASTSAAAPPAPRPAMRSTTPRKTSTGRWSKASSTPRAPTPPASTTTTARSTRWRSRPRATPPRCRGRACGRTSSPSRAATRSTASSTADYQNKSVQRENIDDGFTFLCPGGRCGNLTPSDLNRMERYYDVNGDVGGYVPGLKDRLWWYGSVRQQDILTQVPNFPVKAFETRLRNLTGKLTYALSQNNKLTAYAQGGQKLQPNRLDRFLVGASVARHQLRGVELGAALLGPHLQGRLRVGAGRQLVPRGPRRPVQVPSGPISATPKRRPTRTSATRSSAAATATAGSTSRRATRSPAR